MKKSKFTAVDAVIILVAVLVLVVGAMRLTAKSLSQAPSHSLARRLRLETR